MITIIQLEEINQHNGQGHSRTGEVCSSRQHVLSWGQGKAGLPHVPLVLPLVSLILPHVPLVIPDARLVLPHVSLVLPLALIVLPAIIYFSILDVK